MENLDVHVDASYLHPVLYDLKRRKVTNGRGNSLHAPSIGLCMLKCMCALRRKHR